MKQVSLAIVYYPALKKVHFLKSLHSALSQIGCSYDITIYYESEFPDWPELTNINKKEIPIHIQGNPPKVREFIVKSTENSYLAFWDSDDIYSITRIAEQMKILHKNNADICFADFGFFNSEQIFDDSFFKRIGFGKRKINILDENYIGLGICTGKTDFFKSLLPYPDINALDWWIAIRAEFMNASVVHIDKILGYYRVHDKSMSYQIAVLSEKDFIKENQNKCNLYTELKYLGKEIEKRIRYYNEININKDYENLKQKFANNKYQNIWGGLISYEEK